MLDSMQALRERCANLKWKSQRLRRQLESLGGSGRSQTLASIALLEADLQDLLASCPGLEEPRIVYQEPPTRIRVRPPSDRQVPIPITAA